MALESGTKLGPYEILSPLGAGGMGEVYLALDSKLDRKIAIKVLPELMTRDKERVARFEREAKLLASLNHPNIAAIHGFGDADGSRFLVMEYVEGQTLGNHLKNGPVAVEDALDIAKQIAEALEVAHEQGVIHRDLKPANVMLREDGTVKVLDFGLAKAMSDDPSGGADANSPTITANYTHAGVVLGTAAYMSPEQARGRALDKRTDIWSFGIMLFECLTGERLFQGETANDSMGAIMHKDPEWSLLPPSTPPTIQLLLRRCLAKDRKRRLHDIADARIELENAIADPTSSSLGLATVAIAADASRGRRTARGIFSTAALVSVVAILAGFVAWNLKPAPQKPVRKFSLGIKSYEPTRGIAISPDGRKIVYSANRRLWVREIDKLNPRELPETAHASQPIWSPDSTRIAYATENKLWHIPWQGGSPTAVGTLPTAMLPVGGISWTKDDRLLIATGNTGLHEVSARGGEVRTILEVDEVTEEDFHHAAALPDGRGILFTIHKKGGGADSIELWTPKERKTLLELPGERFDNPVYSNTGHVIYARSTTTPGLWALPFSLPTLSVTGEPFLIASDGARPTVSEDGTLVYIRGTTSIKQRMVWVNREGKVLENVGVPQTVLENPRISPDGKKIAVNAQEPDSRNIWIHDVDRGTKMRLTFDQVQPSRPLWIRGRNQIAYSTGAGQVGPAWITNADGSGQTKELPIILPTSCSYDGKFLLYRATSPDGNADGIGYFSLDGNGEPTPLIQSSTQERNAVFSPDGTLVAYENRDAGLEEVFLTTFPQSDGRWQVSVNSGTKPRWSSKGDELFYVEVGSFNLMSVSVQREPTLTLGTPKKLFSGLTPGVALYNGYDVSEDAQKFVMVQVSDPHSDKRGIAIVQNWFEEFKESR